ncbi:NAD(P)-binding protein [Nocardia brasiliensis]|uniref:NAD(P)-binding protein n=1 Tax=Nocardia brasiliensis TaxID=37326 RepID=UPI003D90774F
MQTFDHIFVGGGHNALVAAAYLSKAGHEVLVIDRNDRVGGFVRSAELTPGVVNPNSGPGDPYGGAQDLAQSFALRPISAAPGHRTFVPNLYVLGSGTWPGAGVSGNSGHIVAQYLL